MYHKSNISPRPLDWVARLLGSLAGKASVEVRDSNPHPLFEFNRISRFLIVGFLLLINLIPNNWDIQAYDFKVDNIYYNILSDTRREVEVTYGAKNQYGQPACLYKGDVVIPREVAYSGCSYTVCQIGESAFCTGMDWNDLYYDYHENLKSIKLPNTIKRIGKGAFFRCEALTSITIPSSVESIGEGVFSNCKNLRTIFIETSMPPTVESEKWGILGYDPNPHSEIIVSQKSSYLQNPFWLQTESQLVEIVTFDKTPIVYDGKIHPLSYVDNLNQYDVIVDVGQKNDVNAGNKIADVQITCCQSGKLIAQYQFDYSYTVEKAPLDIAIENITREYGDDNPELRYTTLSGFVNGETESVLANTPVLTTNAKKDSAPGSYVINATLDDQNYILNNGAGTLTVTKAPLNVSVDNASREYGDYNPEFKLNYQGLKCGELSPKLTRNFKIETTADKYSPVGSYDVMVSSGLSPNYDFTYTSGLLNITKAQLLVRAKNMSKLYYEENPELSYTLSGVKVSGEEPLTKIPSISCNAVKESPVGYYMIVPSGAESFNYNVSYANGELEVKKRQLTITANDCNRKYGEDNPDFTFSYSGFVGGENESSLEKLPVATCSASKNSNVGYYAIWPTDANAQNYSFKYNRGFLTIDKANQQIQWNQDLSDCHVGDQIELLCAATSRLPISYLVGDESIASVYWIGETAYLDCVKPGEVTIRATQEGNMNFIPAVRLSKVVNIKTGSGVDSILCDDIVEDGVVYDLYGRVVKDIIPGQLYIKNGKKYLSNK